MDKQKNSSITVEEAQHTFFNLPELVRDINTGEALSNFMESYKDTKLDVISMSEIKNIMNKTQS